MNESREDGTMVALDDGRILAAGGYNETVELYELVKNNWNYINARLYPVDPIDDVFEALSSHAAKFVLLNVAVGEKFGKELTMTGQYEFACFKLGTS